MSGLIELLADDADLRRRLGAAGDGGRVEALTDGSVSS